MLHGYMGIFDPPDAHIVLYRLSRELETCFVAKYDRACKTSPSNSLAFQRRIKSHSFVIIVAILLKLKPIVFTLQSLTDNLPNCLLMYATL
jgi:hypothetical protein